MNIVNLAIITATFKNISPRVAEYPGRIISTGHGTYVENLSALTTIELSDVIFHRDIYSFQYAFCAESIVIALV